MSEKAKAQQPEIYEFIDQGQRFVTLAKAVMRKHGQDPETQSPSGTIEVEWEQPSTTTRYKLFKKHVGNQFGGVYLAFILECYSADYSATRALSRYMVATDDDGSDPTQIYSVDAHLHPIVVNINVRKHSQKLAAQAGLTILGREVPDLARGLLEQSLHKRFSQITADYILSDLAVEGNEGDITPELAYDALESHHKRARQIGDKVVHKSAVEESSEHHPQPAYRDAVQDALANPRQPDSKNHYKIIEYGRFVARAAIEIGGKWSGIIADPHNHKQHPGTAQDAQAS